MDSQGQPGVRGLRGGPAIKSVNASKSVQRPKAIMTEDCRRLFSLLTIALIIEIELHL
jgi:hypothetical protein